ncbi:MAG: SprB repeat-containing protein, partial [Methylophagaceae bacterium]
MQINIAQTSSPTIYSAVIGYYVASTFFVSYLTTNQITAGVLNLTGFNPNVDYCIRIVDSVAYYTANGGSASGFSTVGIYDEWCTINFSEPAVLQGSPQVFGVSCKGDATGMLVGDASGGSAPYTYCWLDMNGDTSQVTGPIADKDTLFDLFSGIYVLHIYDINGCFVDYTLNVPEPFVALSIDNIALVESIACYSDSVGKAILYASGGMPNYEYLWDNGETTALASSLTSGFHSVVLSDNWGCEVLDSIYIFENSLIESELTTVQDVSCYGASDGVATISSYGGASNVFTYFWSTGQQTVGVNLDTAVGLLYGNYYVITRDALGCEVVDSIYITISTGALSAATTLYSDVDCFGDSSGVAYAENAIGGTFPYTYAWDNGQNTQLVVNLWAGTHTVTVTDANGCTAQSSIDIVNSYAEITGITNILNQVSCFEACDADVEFSAFGGQVPYTYTWDIGQIYYGSSGPDTAFNLCYGGHNVLVEDAIGCQKIFTFTFSEPAQLVAATSVVASNMCFGDCIAAEDLTISGGTGPFSFTVNGGTPIVLPAGDSTYSFAGLCAGQYDIVVTDANGCTAYDTVTITQPDEISNTFMSNAPSTSSACDGFILSSVISSLPIINYSWIDSQGSFMGSSNSISNLCNDAYILTLTDSAGCTFVDTLILGTVFGCTDSLATNYNTFASVDDGSCTYPTVYGCTDS